MTLNKFLPPCFTLVENFAWVKAKIACQRQVCLTDSVMERHVTKLQDARDREMLLLQSTSTGFMSHQTGGIPATAARCLTRAQRCRTGVVEFAMFASRPLSCEGAESLNLQTLPRFDPPCHYEVRLQCME